METNKKLIFLIITLIILGILIFLGSYFGWKWYKSENPKSIQNQPKIIEYKNNEIPKYWPTDLALDQNMKTLSTIETTYSDELIITKRTLESSYPILPTFNFFKDYLNNNLWKITKETNENNQAQKYLAAKREGYLAITISPLENNKTIVVLEYQYNPKNPMTPEPKQEFGKLPPIFPEYLLPKNAKIGGYSEDQININISLSSSGDVTSLLNYFLKNLRSNNWEIISSTSTINFSFLEAENKNLNKKINIHIFPGNEANISNIIIKFEK